MENFDRKGHWENIYRTRKLNEVGWYEPVPENSVRFLKKLNIPLSAKIIDIGGGDSYFADNLLELGYKDITVLDISTNAVSRAKKRLGSGADRIKWIISDAATFEPQEKYDFWHDRAAFHFLTKEPEINHYVDIAQRNINPGGFLVIGTFSEQGPDKCSGLVIKQYSEKSLLEKFGDYFNKIDCFSYDHVTPSGNIQNYVFCSFQRKTTNN